MNNDWNSPFNLNEFNILTRVPAAAGIYLLGRSDGDEWRWYYVAHTVNLQRRLLSHLTGSGNTDCVEQALRRQDTQVTFVPLDAVDSRSGKTRYLWEAIKPECNVRAPSGIPELISLPPMPERDLAV